MIHWFNANPGLAGWVQAFGAILALVITVRVVKLQANYANKHLNAQVAARLAVLARLIGHLSIVCERGYAIRVSSGASLDVDGLNLLLMSFNWAAGELNKFNFVDAPSETVFDVFIQYRELCSPLSDWMNPSVPTTEELLRSFSAHIEKLRSQEAIMWAEERRFRSNPPSQSGRASVGGNSVP